MVKRETPADNETTTSTPDESTETAVETIDGFNEDQLRAVESLTDVLQMTGGNVGQISKVLGNGFSVLDNKAALLDTEFVIVRCGFHKSEVGSKKEFVTLHVVTTDGRKLVVNDGGSGIYAQAKEMVKMYGRVAPLHVPKGLRASTYDYTDADGNTSEATTYYLNTAS